MLLHISRRLVVDSATAKLGDQKLDKILKGPWRGNIANVEAVQVSLTDPALHLIGHLLRVSDRRRSQAANGGLLGNHARRPLGHLLARYCECIEETLHLVRLNRIGRREFLVERDGRQVNAGPSADKHKPANRRRVLLQFIVLLLGLLVGAADNGGECPKELERLGVAAQLSRLVSDRLDLGLQELGRVRGDKDALGVRSCKRLAGGRRTSLEQERRALRRRVDNVTGVEIKELAVVVNGSDLVGVRIAVVLGVRGDCVVCPGAFPKPKTMLGYMRCQCMVAGLERTCKGPGGIRRPAHISHREQWGCQGQLP